MALFSGVHPPDALFSAKSTGGRRKSGEVYTPSVEVAFAYPVSAV